MNEKNKNILKNRIIGWLAIIITALVVYGLFAIVKKDWDTIASFEWRIDWAMMAVSILITALSIIINTKAMQRLLKAFGGRIPFERFGLIFTAANFAKYVPGKIVQIASVFMLIKREGVRNSVALSAITVYQAMLIIICGLVGLFLVGPDVLGSVAKTIPPWSIYAVSVVGLILTTPRILGFFINKISAILKREKLSYNLSFRDWGITVLAIIFAWLMVALSFALMAKSLVHIPNENLIFIGGSYLMAYIVGWIFFFAPGGIGFREGALVILLNIIFSSGLSGLIAAVARIWMLAAELLSLGILYAIFIIYNKRNPNYLINRKGMKNDEEN